MSDISYRAAGSDEGARLADLRVRAMQPSLEAAGRFDPDRAHARFLDRFVPAETQVIVRVLPSGSEEILGLFVLRDGTEHLTLESLYLEPHAQGFGIGRAVVSHAKTRASQARTALRVSALRGSPANEFYLSLGFAQIGEEPFDIHYEWGPDQ